MSAYYNEHDPFAAAWLRELIKAGAIAPGDVDERSIEDVTPSELSGYAQCHFFAGIGVWSYALRLAGIPDDLPVWTGSCPCQPFSQAGKGKGFADERHLWPAWFHLIEQCGPSIVFGEQVADSGGLAWLDLVWTDMEAMGYAFGAVPAPAAGFGAPHIRLRDFWVAHAYGRQRDWGSVLGGAQRHGQDAGRSQGLGFPEPRLEVRGLAHATGCGRGEECPDCRRGASGDRPQGVGAGFVNGCGDFRLAHADDPGLEGRTGMPERPDQRPVGSGGVAERVADADNRSGFGRGIQRPGESDSQGDGAPHERSEGFFADGRGPGPVNGFWRDADWLGCRDGKWRPVEPGTSPLAHESANRVGRLRGYGNAIVAEQAATFIEAAMMEAAE